MTNIEAATEGKRTLDPSRILMNLIVALLAPMFLGVSAGDVGFARMAAIETVNAYRARNHSDLIAIAQIIAFGLAALGSLSLSMADDISLSMTLRLRGNANACNRSAEQNRRVLTEGHRDDPMQHPASTPVDITEDDHVPPDSGGICLSPAAARLLAAEAQGRLREPEPKAGQPSSKAEKTPERRHQEMWAIVMVNEAAEITANIPNLPPDERQAATLQASTLSSTAHDLLYGMPEPVKPGPLGGLTLDVPRTSRQSR
jgi:hypothetical protein